MDTPLTPNFSNTFAKNLTFCRRTTRSNKNVKNCSILENNKFLQIERGVNEDV